MSIAISIRGFRPGRFGEADDMDPELKFVKQNRIEMYAARVEAGLPLFEAEGARARQKDRPRSLRRR